MNEYLLLIHKLDEKLAPLSPETQEEFVKKCIVYIDKLQKNGNLKSAQPLQQNRGREISGTINALKDGPFHESKEVKAGYYHILAKDMKEAVAIGKENPEFEYGTNVRIEVIPIKTTEKDLDYVYPSEH